MIYGCAVKLNAADYPDGPVQAALAQIRDAHAWYRGFGETGEFTLSSRANNQIVFLLSHRHYDLDKPKPVPWDSKLAEPMRLALSGKSGTVIGLDYRGATVLAAHEPVAVLDLGIVAKVDLEEIRAPFMKAALLSSCFAIAAIALGAGVFFKLTDPILKNCTKPWKSWRKRCARSKRSGESSPFVPSAKRSATTKATGIRSRYMCAIIPRLISATASVRSATMNTIPNWRLKQIPTNNAILLKEIGAKASLRI